MAIMNSSGGLRRLWMNQKHKTMMIYNFDHDKCCLKISLFWIVYTVALYTFFAMYFIIVINSSLILFISESFLYNQWGSWNQRSHLINSDRKCFLLVHSTGFLLLLMHFYFTGSVQAFFFFVVFLT